MKTKYRIVAATKPWHRLDYIIQKKLWWWPFWYEATNHSYSDVEYATKVANRLKTDVRI